jgi:hypothetical protein
LRNVLFFLYLLNKQLKTNIMKVQIETSLSNPYTTNYKYDLITLDGIVRCATSSTSLDKLKDDLSAAHTSGFTFGFGSNHCWVKQNGYENRILLITNN